MCVRTTCPTDGFMMAEQLSPQQWYAVAKGVEIWLHYLTCRCGSVTRLVAAQPRAVIHPSIMFL